MANFWHNLPNGFVGLSPMDGVSDCAFRTIQKKYGNPDVMYTEFTSVEGIAHGATRLLKDFMYEKIQHPIVGQIFGHTPKDFHTSAVIVCELGFDGVDINMGCPAKTVAAQGAGAALIKTPKLAQEIIKETQQGVSDWVNGMSIEDLPITQEMKFLLQQKKVVKNDRELLPVSVKTRVGYDQPVIEEWIPNLLEMQPSTIAIHGRTLKQAYSGLAQWEYIGKAVELTKGTDTYIIGNGDVKSRQEAREKISTYGVNGVLIGRETFGNPWVFSVQGGSAPGGQESTPTTQERFEVAIEHTLLYEKLYNIDEHYQFLPMRKHLGWYIKDFPNAGEVRQQLFTAKDAKTVLDILERNKPS